MKTQRAFHGVIPAMAVPFRDDYKIDGDGLARFARWLAGCRGVTAVMTNGHTGEVGSLLPEERAEVTRIVADAVKGRVRVVSAICSEGTFEALEHARAAAHAGADTVDIMPCHMWLRFGVKEDAVYEYFKAIGAERAPVLRRLAVRCGAHQVVEHHREVVLDDVPAQGGVERLRGEARQRDRQVGLRLGPARRGESQARKGHGKQ
ncbi:MAG: dihydrodipicolinate synthase family protein [Chloroflexota bacterium]|nr:dihydrodipicolinate synthase family protein [Chloroflexota bacterium]